MGSSEFGNLLGTLWEPKVNPRFHDLRRMITVAEMSSGLSRKQIEDIIERGAVDQIKGGSVAKGPKCWRMMVSYQYNDPADIADARRAGRKPKQLRQRLARTTDIHCVSRNNSGKPDAKKELEDWRLRILADCKEVEGKTEDASSSVASYAEAWVSSREDSGSIALSTSSSYRDALGLLEKGKGRIDGLAVEDIRKADVQKWINGLNVAGYAPETIRKAKRVLAGMCRYAIDRGDLRANPCLGVDMPKGGDGNPNALDEAEMQRLNAYLNGHPATKVVTAARLALQAGLRVEEVCGLRWGDVKISRDGNGAVTGGTIYIRNVIGRAYRMNPDGKRVYYIFEKSPKTSKSQRAIPIAKPLAEALLSRRAVMLEEAKCEGVTLTDSDYVVGTVTAKSRKGMKNEPHKYADPHNVGSVAWAKIASSLKLVGTEGRTPTFHDLRHTFATHALRNHMNVRVLADYMGHRDPSVTLRRYATALPLDISEEGERVGLLMAVASEPAEILELKPTGTEG